MMRRALTYAAVTVSSILIVPFLVVWAKQLYLIETKNFVYSNHLPSRLLEEARVYEQPSGGPLYLTFLMPEVTCEPLEAAWNRSDFDGINALHVSEKKWREDFENLATATVVAEAYSPPEQAAFLSCILATPFGRTCANTFRNEVERRRKNPSRKLVEENRLIPKIKEDFCNGIRSLVEDEAK